METDELFDLIDRAEKLITSIHDAESLLLATYGSGCEDHGVHPDQNQIFAAGRTLIIHLSWLKSRAASLAMLRTADDTTKRRIISVGTLR